MTFTRISVLIPTRGRVARLQTVLESFERTVSEQNAELVFKVDDDDHETIQFLTSQTGPYKIVVGPRYRGYADMPLYFNELAARADGDVLLCGNDDMIFQTEDWPTSVLFVANQFPDGLFDVGVSTLNHENFPFSIVSKMAVEKMGFLWDPRVFWGDIFLRDVMARFGRCIYLSVVHIDHDWAGFKPDKVYLEALMPGEHTKDILRRNPQYWLAAHKPAVDDAVAKLKELLQ